MTVGGLNELCLTEDVQPREIPMRVLLARHYPMHLKLFGLLSPALFQYTCILIIMIISGTYALLVLTLQKRHSFSNC